MSIESTRKTVSAPAQEAATEAPSSGYTAQHETISLSGRRLPGSLSYNRGTEALTRANTAFEKQFKVITLDAKPGLLKMDRAIHPSLDLSALVVTMHENTANPGQLWYYTLLLEDLVALPRTQREQNGTRGIDTRVFPESVFNDRYVAAIEGELRRQYPDTTLICVSGEVVPQGFAWEDDAAAYTLCVNALLACYNPLYENTPESVPMDLAKLAKSEHLKVGINFRPEARFNQAGRPIRSDIAVQLSTVLNNQQQTGRNQGARVTPVAEAVGFIDMAFVGHRAPVAYGNQGRQTHAARFVVTNLVSLERTTAADQLLAFFMAAVVIKDQNWYPAFRPTFGSGSDSLRDITKLNIEANLTGDPSGFGQPAVFGAEDTDRQLAAFLEAAVHPEAKLALDVSEFGSDTWANQLFAASTEVDANGNLTKLAQEANELILSTLDTMCHGRFAEVYGNSNLTLFEPGHETILLGSFESDGHLHDLRKIDLVALLNLRGQQDPKIGAQWTETLYSTHLSEAEAVARRCELIEAILPQANITGTARRLTANTAVLNMIGEAFSKINLDLRVERVSGGDFRTSRVVAPWSSNTQFSTKAFSSGSGSTTFSRGLGSASLGRGWVR